MFDLWLHSGNTWFIIGLVLCILEVSSGSLIFFLPMGIGGLLTGVLLKSQEAALLPTLLNNWMWTLIFWAVLSLLLSLLMNVLMRNQSPDDINKY